MAERGRVWVSEKKLHAAFDKRTIVRFGTGTLVRDMKTVEKRLNILERQHWILRVRSKPMIDKTAISLEAARAPGAARVSMQCMAKPKEITEIGWFIASPTARSVSGQSMGVCGNLEALRCGDRLQINSSSSRFRSLRVLWMKEAGMCYVPLRSDRAWGQPL